MALLRDRLREWWRVHYLERGVGFLVPGFERRIARDLRTIQLRCRAITETHPPNWSVAVYRGSTYAAPTSTELARILSELYARGNVPAGCRMAPRLVGPETSRSTYLR